MPVKPPCSYCNRFHVRVGVVDLQGRRQKKLDRAAGELRRQFDHGRYFELVSARLDGDRELVVRFVFGIRRPRYQKQQRNPTPGAAEISQALMQCVHGYGYARTR